MVEFKTFSRLVEKALLLTIIAAIFLCYSSPIGLGDFWWHLATGDYILKHGEIPTEDPFTYTATSDEDRRKSLILGGYWLAQAGYSVVHRTFGFQGLVLLKAALFFLIFLVLWRILKTRGVELYWTLFIIAILAVFLKPYEEVRPHVFSFLGALIVFDRIETALSSLGLNRTIKPSVLVALPVTMLLWSNLHPGYIVGIAMMSIYLIAEALKYIFKKDALADKAFLRFLCWIFLSLGASLVNPVGWIPVYYSLMDYRASVMAMTIEEYFTPWKYASYTGNRSALYGPLIIAALSLLPMALSWRKLRISHILLYTGFAFAGFSAFRFSVFFMLTAVAISAFYMSENITRKIRVITVPAALVSITLLLILGIRTTSMTREAVTESLLPGRACDFISRHDLPDPLFNPYEWSGYLTWKFYPRYRLFVDSRTLDFDVHIKYMAANLGIKDKVFEEYGINTVVFYPIKSRTYKVPGIIFSLLKDDRWNLIYFDEISVIFVRARAKPGLPVYPKDILWNTLIKTGEMWIKNPPGNADPYQFLGEVYRAKGDEEKAREYFNMSAENAYND